MTSIEFQPLLIEERDLAKFYYLGSRFLVIKEHNGVLRPVVIEKNNPFSSELVDLRKELASLEGQARHAHLAHDGRRVKSSIATVRRTELGRRISNLRGFIALQTGDVICPIEINGEEINFLLDFPEDIDLAWYRFAASEREQLLTVRDNINSCQQLRQYFELRYKVIHGNPIEKENAAIELDNFGNRNGVDWTKLNGLFSIISKRFPRQVTK